MCLGPKTPPDNSARIAAEAEDKRQANIAQGVTAIDEAFAGYNEPFYKQYEQDYLGYYTPQLNTQYEDAVRDLTLQLAKTGNLTGSTGAKQLGDLEKYYGTQSSSIANQAANAANVLRGDIDKTKSNLYSTNVSVADPASTAQSAISAASSLQPSTPDSPLANVFTDFFSTLGNVAAIRNVTGPNSPASGVQSYGGSSTKGANYY